MMRKMTKKNQKHIGYSILKALGITVLLASVALCLLPFLWMIIMSLKLESEMWIMPPSLHPSTMTLDVYKDIWQMDVPSVKMALGNSVFIAVVATSGSILTAALAAYAFAKLEFKGKSKLFFLILSTMMIPGQITLIPMYVIIKKIGWINTFLPLIIPPVLTYSYGVFMLRQYFATIPDSILESAKIDGASQPRMFVSLMLPLAKPAVATLLMIRFMGIWNSFLSPMLYINDPKKMTLPLYIRYFEGAYSTDWNYMMAASCITIFPMVIIYLLTQRYLTEGIMLGGVKG